MTFEEIKGLHEMGFSNEEIMKLSTISTGNPQPEPQPAPKPDDNPLHGPKPQPAPKPDDNPLPGPKPQPESKQEPDEVQQLRDEVKQLREQLQQSNRQNMFIDNLPKDLQTKTDEIMAELIRPTIKEDKK